MPRWREPAPQRRAASGAELARGDGVAQAAGLELVAQLAVRLGVYVHEVRQRRRLGGVGKREIVAHVVGEPVHLPAAEEALARRAHLLIAERQIAWRLLEHHLPDVGRIDRHPAMAAGEKLGTAVLRLADVGRADAEALVAVLRRRDADAVDIARRHADRTREPDVERV